MLQLPQELMSKIVPYQDYNKENYSGKKVVLVGGCFDILHVGHIRFLEAAKKEGEILVIALEGDAFIKKNKKRDPFHSHEERAEVLAALQAVDVVLMLPLFSVDAEYSELVEKVKPAVIAITQNDPYESYKQKQATMIGGEVKSVIAEVPRKSTTEVLKTNPTKELVL